MILEQPEQTILVCPDYSCLVTSKTIRGRHAITNRVCSLCGSNKTTATRRIGKHGQIWTGYNWRRTIDGDIICSTCASRLEYPKRKEYYKNIANPKTHAKWSPRRVSYKGKLLYVPEKPRTGICSDCGRSIASGEIRRTNLHHEQYDDSKPLAHTIELCVSCHNKRHPDKYKHGD